MPYLRVSSRKLAMEARLGMHDSNIGHRRLGENAGDIARMQSACSSASTSLNSTTLVVTEGSTGGPTLPRRGFATPFSRVIKVSSTVP